MYVPPSVIKLPFVYDFGRVDAPPVILEETARVSPSEGGPSTSGIFWLNSGSKVISSMGRGHSLQGDLDISDPWFLKYAKNPDADFGVHPQNLLRLYTRQKFLHTSCSVVYRMNHYWLSKAPERKESNGLLVMSRATPDGADSYYGGVRVDGKFTIKRKKAGIYTTLAEGKIYPGTYRRDTNPNLLPINAWIGIKLATKTLPNGNVQLTLWRDQNWTGMWSQLATVEDKEPITHEGLHALRTDFADVTFDAFKIEAAL